MAYVEGWIFLLVIGGAIALIHVVGFTVLQVFLSKKDNKWLGLILPIVSLLPFAQHIFMLLWSGDWGFATEELWIGMISPIYLLIVYSIVRLWRRRKHNPK